ncbi:MAG TPA: arsenite methyltransferase [Myxococcota bacterium]|nr:arsenite methyltransferase [Myxococcota bacterium]HPV03079.1 arsenite methyltransferase [Myxococcota bacterium]
MSKADDVRKMVSESYSAAVKAALARRKAKQAKSAPSKSCCCGGAPKISEQSLAELAGYSREALAGLPPDAVTSSFGCGNPVALAAIREGDTVLDLGSGAGIDLLLAARLAGPSGRVIGVDMTPAMIERARANAEKAGLKNVEVRQGIIEDLPVESGTVDLVISNCVINLSPEKNRVFAELARVLKPGGRISISDICAEMMPDWAIQAGHLYSACISGAIPEAAYIQGLVEAGLEDVKVTDRLVYDAQQLSGLLGSVESRGCCGGSSALTPAQLERAVAELVGTIASLRFVGMKPVV